MNKLICVQRLRGIEVIPDNTVVAQGRRQDFSPRGGIENARGGKDFNVLNIPVTSQPPYLLR